MVLWILSAILFLMLLAVVSPVIRERLGRIAEYILFTVAPKILKFLLILFIISLCLLALYFLCLWLYRQYQWLCSIYQKDPFSFIARIVISVVVISGALIYDRYREFFQKHRSTITNVFLLAFIAFIIVVCVLCYFV